MIQDTHEHRILVVDDDASIRQGVTRFLNLCGYKTAQAEDGLEALSILRRRDLGRMVLVTDFNMPNLDGGALIRATRDEHLPVQGIVLMTADYLAIRQLKLQELRTALHSVPLILIPKPFSLDSLSAAIRCMVHGSRVPPPLDEMKLIESAEFR